MEENWNSDMVKLEDKFEGIRVKEQERILERLGALTHQEREIYMQAYADALEYAHNFLRDFRIYRP